jgi:hypothetical protein
MRWRRARGSRQRSVIRALTYLATGIEAYVFGSGRGPDWLLEADPQLYELVRQVIPSTNARKRVRRPYQEDNSRRETKVPIALEPGPAVAARPTADQRLAR